MIPGFATSEETKAFSEKFINENYNKFQNLHLSNVGIGTYLGEPDSQTDCLSMLYAQFQFAFIHSYQNHLKKYGLN